VTSRLAAALVSIVLIGATLSVLRRDPNDDGFPLSTYPMFAHDRGRDLVMAYALGITAAGERRYLTPRIVGSDEVLQAMRIIERALRDRQELEALCARIAARVRGHADYRDIVTIKIVRGTHDVVDFLVREVLGPERERMRCGVLR
jgi:hypothetical protein